MDAWFHWFGANTSNPYALLVSVVLIGLVFEMFDHILCPLVGGMIKDGGITPSTTCKIAAQQLVADKDIVGVVGAMRSSCSISSHQYFRDNGKKLYFII